MTLSEMIRNWFLMPVLKELKKMAQTLQDVLDGVTVVAGKVSEIATKVADLSTDIDEAVAKLQADIAAGGDMTPAVEALAALATQLGTASDALTAIDVKAEAISGKPTP